MNAGKAPPSLDPEDWTETRAQAHRMLDDILDYVAQIRDRPVWQPIPDAARAPFRQDLPRAPQPLDRIHAEFLDWILPFAGGNVHPGFMGWVQGGGNVAGLLAEMLAGGLNANLGGRDHMPIEVERQVVRWAREMFSFPDSASGLFVTGTSLANLMALLVARRWALGPAVRRDGLGDSRLVGYASRAAHGCVRKAFDLSGLGTNALHEIATDTRHRIDVAALQARLAADRAQGLKPFIVIASAGTVDVGAVDALAEIAALCRREGLWFHVDGALGALGVLSPDIAPRLAGIELADSIAFDFHKWGQVPYDAGFLLVRDGQMHLDTFAAPAAYLRRETRGLAAGSPWPTDLGPDLSRGFRALKTWFTLKAHGTEQLGAMMAKSCALARHAQARIEGEAELELLSPAQLNIVCFRFAGPAPDALNAAIAVELQESGIAVASTTDACGPLALRAAIVNHRTEERDIDRLIDAVLAIGRRHIGATKPSGK